MPMRVDQSVPTELDHHRAIRARMLPCDLGDRSTRGDVAFHIPPRDHRHFAEVDAGVGQPHRRRRVSNAQFTRYATNRAVLPPQPLERSLRRTLQPSGVAAHPRPISVDPQACQRMMDGASETPNSSAISRPDRPVAYRRRSHAASCRRGFARNCCPAERSRTAMPCRRSARRTVDAATPTSRAIVSLDASAYRRASH